MPKIHHTLSTTILAMLTATQVQLATAAATSRHESAKAIVGAVRHHLEQRLRTVPGRHEIEVSRLDPRLRLPQCGTPLQVDETTARAPIGKLTLRVRCEGPRKPWRIYVGAHVASYRDVLVSAGYLARMHPLGPQDLVREERDVSQLPRGYYEHQEGLVGMIVKRPVPAGRVLSPDMVRPPLLVKRGQSVTIIARHAGLAVRMTGKALADGALGATIRVRNDRSHRIVEGRVSAGRQITVSSRES